VLSGPGIYERLGIPTIINAKGLATRVSGPPMPEEVARAMQEASAWCVEMAVLQSHASRRIAAATGAEAGMVTSGAAAALLAGTAACMAGLDPGRMNRLPDTRGMREEVVMVRSQRNFYDHAVRATGARIVEVGLPDRYSGAGVRDAEAWEIADAIGERTACVFYVAQPQSLPALTSVCQVAHEAGVPVLVDAAAQLPPVSNLRRFLAEGADLVAFSGGKGIRGPQASGILCGRRDLVASAALQTLDMDLPFEQWQPPPGLFDGINLRGLPQHGIARSCKVGKEQIVGLLVALEAFTEDSVQRELARQRGLLDALKARMPGRLAGSTAILDTHTGMPALALRLDPAGRGLTASGLILALQTGEPSIHADPARAHENVVLFNAAGLKVGDPEAIAARLAAIFGQA
jgi:L-seryl-tRNA(Ser) seleniumtransferase